MVPLDFDGPIFHRTAASATLFQFFGQGGDGRMGKAGYQGHALALASFGFPADPDDPVSGRRGFGFFTDAVFLRTLAGWTNAAEF